MKNTQLTHFVGNIRFIALALIGLLLIGCAANKPKPAPKSQPKTDNRQIANIDPFENWNRKTYAFNKKLDSAFLLPASNAYAAITPDSIERSIGNFFNNLSEIGNIVNNLLQGKVVDSAHVTSRFLVNSTFGIVGLFDVASYAGMDKRPEDFGQTLGKWGVPAGPYLVLPLLGPSNIRDTAAMPVDNNTDLVDHVVAPNHQTAAQVVNVLNIRQGLKSVEGLIFGDEYIFVRDAYLSRRFAKVNDGNINAAQPLFGDNEFADDEFGAAGFDEFD